MKRTREVLLDCYRTLHLSPSVRGLIITELASDVVEMTKTLTEKGVSPEKAESTSLETLAVTGNSSLEMNRLHGHRMLVALAELPKGAAAALAVLMSSGALLALFMIIRQGSITGAAGWFVYAALAILFTALVLFWRMGRVVFLKKSAITESGAHTESVLKALAVGVISIPFAVSAVELTGTDPLQAVFWLRTTAAMLSTGLASGVLITVMLILVQHRKASLLSSEKQFIDKLDSILEELI